MFNGSSDDEQRSDDDDRLESQNGTVEAVPPGEVEADPIPAPVTRMLAVPPAAGPVAVPVAPPAETPWSVGRCILIGLGVAVALFVVMMLV